MEQAFNKNKRAEKITFFGALLIVLGASIGAGIFFKSKSVLENSGYNLALAIGNWIIACFSIVAMAIALVEISSTTKKSNLSIIIWNKVFNSESFFQISKNFIIYLYLPFTYFVLPVYFMQILQDSIAAFRLESTSEWNISSDWIIVLAASILITIYFFVIGLNTKIAEFHNKIFLIAKFLPILVTIIVGFVLFFQGGSNKLSNNITFLPLEKIKTKGASISSSLPGVGVLVSMAGIFFSYEGFFTAAGLQTEMKNPKKTPIAILVGIGITTIIYLFIAIATSIVGDGSISSFIQIAKNELNWSGLTIKLILGTTFLLIGISLLGIINIFTLWGPRALEELITRNEFSLLKKWKNFTNLNKPIVSTIFLSIFSIICLVIFTLIGVFAFDDQGYGNYGQKLNNLYSFADITGNWAALISFLLIAAAIYGCIRNRKTQKIPVQKQKYFLFFAYISVIFISIVLIFALFTPVIDLILISLYKPQIYDFDQILKTRITKVVVLLLFILVPSSPLICCWVQKKIKNIPKKIKNSLQYKKVMKINLEKYIRTVEDFPKKGISFKDISPLLADGKALNYAIVEMASLAKDVDIIVGPDARGFLFGTPTAAFLSKPFVMVRKAGKLPGEVEEFAYELEYGSAILEVQVGMIKPGQKVAIVDDVLATGGTVKAITKMIERAGATVSKIIFLIELEKLQGRKNLQNYDVTSLIKIS